MWNVKERQGKDYCAQTITLKVGKMRSKARQKPFTHLFLDLALQQKEALQRSNLIQIKQGRDIINM